MQSLYLKAFNYLENYKLNHLGIYFSLLLHLLILLFAIGLPDFFKPKKIPIPQVIPIEILNISDVTSLIPKKENIEIDNKESKKIKQKKFSSTENTEIQKIDLMEKPKKKININQKTIDDDIIIKKPDFKIVTLKKNESNNIKEQKNLEDSVETLKQNKIKPKLKPKVIEAVENKTDVQIQNQIKQQVKKNDEKPLEKPKLIEKPEPDFNLATMLKDLRNEDIVDTSKENKEDEDNIEEDQEENFNANLDVSISEMDLVLQQLRSCFNPRAGTQIIGDEMVKISAKIDRQANVRKDTVQIIATNISNSNPYYEAITESAVATLYNPICSKLKLPLNKYESWKDLKITIDYSWIKN